MSTERKLIYLDDIEKQLRAISSDTTCPLHIAAEIDQILGLAEPVDAVEVVHGQWEKSEPGYSICGHCKADVAIFSGHRNYCPNCGATKDGGAEDGTAD